MLFSLLLQVLGFSDRVPFSYENLMFQCYQKFCHIYYSDIPLKGENIYDLKLQPLLIMSVYTQGYNLCLVLIG
jgi:hypothetical protein